MSAYFNDSETAQASRESILVFISLEGAEAQVEEQLLMTEEKSRPNPQGWGKIKRIQ